MTRKQYEQQNKQRMKVLAITKKDLKKFRQILIGSPVFTNIEKDSWETNYEN